MQNQGAKNNNFITKVVPVIFLNFYRRTTTSIFICESNCPRDCIGGTIILPSFPFFIQLATIGSRRRDSRFRARNESGERILVTSSIILRGMSQPIPIPAPLATRRTPSPSFHFAFHITGVRIPRRFSAPFQASLLCTARNSANDLTPRPAVPFPAIPPLEATAFSYPNRSARNSSRVS